MLENQSSFLVNSSKRTKTRYNRTCIRFLINLIIIIEWVVVLKGGIIVDLSPVGSRIKTARENKKLTQEELAAMVDLSPTHISVIERGVKSPKLETFVRIANALGVSADSLLVDVVENSTKGISCELYDYVSNLSKKEREKVLAVVRVMTE